MAPFSDAFRQVITINFESKQEIVKCDHLNEIYRAVFSWDAKFNVVLIFDGGWTLEV